MSVEQWWKNTDSGKLNNWEKKVQSVDGKWMDEQKAAVVCF